MTPIGFSMRCSLLGGRCEVCHDVGLPCILASASAALRRTFSSGSWRAAARAGTASAAGGPIFPSASAALRRTSSSGSWRAAARAGTVGGGADLPQRVGGAPPDISIGVIEGGGEGRHGLGGGRPDLPQRL